MNLNSIALLGSMTLDMQAAGGAATHFVLTGSDKELVKSVPLVYTANAFGCAGGNISPELHWSGAPAGTLSLVVTLFDPDERSTPSGWLPAGTLQGRSDLGENAYHGPCPAEGDPPHRYTFTVYAVNVAKLPVPADSSGGMVTSIVQEHLSGKAVLVARYGRPK